MKPDWESVNKYLQQIESSHDENIFGYMKGEEFSLIIQSLLVSKDGYVIDIGDFENVNYAYVYGLIKKIKKHPILWKLFMLS